MIDPPTETSRALDPSDYRADFPVLSRRFESGSPLIYLDNAASTQRPIAVMQAMDDCYRQYYGNVHRGIHTLSEESTQRFEDARQRVAAFLGTSNEREIVFTSGTTAAINLVARSWGDANLSRGDTILLTLMEHHANIVPWQQLADRRGCQIVFAPLTDDFQLDLDAFDRLLAQHSPSLVAVSAASNVLGTINPVAHLVQKSHALGARCLVDAAQAAPHMALDVSAWDADWVALSGHKLCGPTGIGVLYGKQSLLESMPPFLGGGAMIDRVTTQGFTPAEVPEKFEAGTPAIAEAIGLHAAIDYITAIGLSRIAAHERSLSQVAHDGLSKIEGLRILGPDPSNKAGIISFTVDRVHPHDMSYLLDRYGIAIRAGHHCAMPLHESLGVSASTRASFYLYNTVAEVEAFVDAVAEAQDKFSRRGKGSRR